MELTIYDFSKILTDLENLLISDYHADKYFPCQKDQECYRFHWSWNGQRLVSIEKANSAEEAEKNWRRRGVDPRSKLVTVTTDMGVMGSFRNGRL